MVVNSCTALMNGDDKYGRMGHRNPMPDYRDNWDDDDDRYGERHGGRRGGGYRY